MGLQWGAQRENDTQKHKESSKRKCLRKAKLVWGTWIKGSGWDPLSRG